MDHEFANSMIAKSKIDAIKIIRSLPVRLEERMGVTVATADIGLFAAKNLVESIIALGTNPDNELLKKHHEELKKNYSELDDKYYGLVNQLRNLMDAHKLSF
jgi:hypothetical protein